MIEKGDLHAIEIITPDDLHYPMTMDALDAGLHVLCEKPLALNAAQAKEMYEKAEAAGVVHMTFFTYRWLPHYRYLKELVDEGYVGRCFPLPHPVPGRIRLARPSTGGGLTASARTAPWATWART